MLSKLREQYRKHREREKCIDALTDVLKAVEWLETQEAQVSFTDDSVRVLIYSDDHKIRFCEGVGDNIVEAVTDAKRIREEQKQWPI